MYATQSTIWNIVNWKLKEKNMLHNFGADYNLLMDTGFWDHWYQCVLPHYFLCGLVNSQQSTKGGKCVHWDSSVSSNGNLYYLSYLSNLQKRHCQNICRGERWPNDANTRGKRVSKQWSARVEPGSLQRRFSRYPTTKIGNLGNESNASPMTKDGKFALLSSHFCKQWESQDADSQNDCALQLKFVSFMVLMLLQKFIRSLVCCKYHSQMVLNNEPPIIISSQFFHLSRRHH